MKERTPTTKDEARQYAIDWQNWASKQNLYMSDLLYWQDIFKRQAVIWDLVDEFKENGII